MEWEEGEWEGKREENRWGGGREGVEGERDQRGNKQER